MTTTPSRLRASLRFAVGILVVVVVSACASTRDSRAGKAPRKARAVQVPILLGPTPPDEPVEFDLVLKQPHAAELDAYANGVTSPTSPHYQHFLTAAEIGERYGVSGSQVAQVTAWLARRGVTTLDAFAQRTAIRVRAPARTVDRVFQVTLLDYRDDIAGQRYHRPRAEPKVPVALHATVDAIAQLDSREYRQPMSTPASVTSAHACLADATCLSADGLARAFDIEPLHNSGILGDGEYVAVIMDGKVADSDLRQWANIVGRPASPPIERITVGKGPSAKESSDPTSTLEGTMDVELVQAVAPHAKVLYFYSSLNEFADAVNQIVADGRAHTITYSAGGCDTADALNDPDVLANRRADSDAVKAAAVAGVNVLASSGDHGAFNCLASDPNDFSVAASEPSDLPFVISVGGTFLRHAADGSYVDESAWESPLTNWATGGGLNPVDPRPSWQKGLGVANGQSNGKRQTPDVAAPGDPLSGMFIVVNGKDEVSGGTSASSPFWAGLSALYGQLARKAGIQRLGFLDPTLYALAAANPANTLFHDIVRGGNLYYPATPGWDYATGLGSPIAAPLGLAIVQYLRTKGG